MAMLEGAVVGLAWWGGSFLVVGGAMLALSELT